MRKIQKRESELIKSVSVALRFIRSSRGLEAQDVRWTSALREPEWNGDFSPTSKNAPGIYRGTACQFAKKERISIMVKNKVVIERKRCMDQFGEFHW